jgi:hypothetical protein
MKDGSIMIWSKTDRHERTYPAEVPFRYKTRAGNEFRRYLLTDRKAPVAVVHRSALAVNPDVYARELLASRRYEGKRRTPRPVTVTSKVTSKPAKPLSPQDEYKEAMKVVAKLQAELAKVQAVIAAAK